MRELKRQLLSELFIENEKDILVFEKVLDQSLPNKQDFYHITKDTYDLLCDAIEILQDIFDKCTITMVKKTIDKMDAIHDESRKRKKKKRTRVNKRFEISG